MAQKSLTLTATLAAALAFVMVLPLTADARSKRSGYNGLEDGYVVARSRFGNGQTSAPVRATRLGPQVRLPSGHWTYCRRSCSETLRVKTVDKDRHLVDGSLPVGSDFARECGLFGCLDVRRSF